jgi:hypothetical protein
MKIIADCHVNSTEFCVSRAHISNPSQILWHGDARWCRCDEGQATAARCWNFVAVCDSTLVWARRSLEAYGWTPASSPPHARNDTSSRLGQCGSRWKGRGRGRNHSVSVFFEGLLASLFVCLFVCLFVERWCSDLDETSLRPRIQPLVHLITSSKTRAHLSPRGLLTLQV